MRRLRQYQKHALGYTMRERHPALLMEMRLGKSLVTLRRMMVGKPRNRRRGMRTLIVAPNSALDSWEEELELEGQDRVTRLTGPRDRRLRQLKTPSQFYLLNKEGWLVVPEIAGRHQCPTCGGLGKIKSTRGLKVVNKRTDDYDVYIGRGTKWGNPFRIGTDGTREEVVAMYRAHLLTRPDLIADLHELANQRLGCHCAPRLCHGDELVDLVRKHVKPRYCKDCKGRGYGPTTGPTKWDHVVIDESFIRNPQSRVTDFFIKSFRDVPHRWLLTGLANPESRLEYWSQIAWLDGMAFGHWNYWSFRATNFEPHPWGHGWIEKPGVAKEIDKAVGRRCFVLTRKAAGIKNKKVYQRRTLELPPGIMKMYRQAEQEFCRTDAKGGQEETIFATTRWVWMRQLCGGFMDGKLVWKEPYTELVTLLKGELSKEQVVVWFAYVPELEQAARAMKAAKIPYGTLYGKIKSARRPDIKKRFRSRKTRVLLVQIDLGKTGMNLGVADTAIYFSNSPSLDSRRQSEDRILLTHKHTALLYLDIVVKDTVSQDVRDVLRSKRWKSDVSIQRAVRERIERRHCG